MSQEVIPEEENVLQPASLNSGHRWERCIVDVPEVGYKF